MCCGEYSYTREVSEHADSVRGERKHYSSPIEVLDRFISSGAIEFFEDFRGFEAR